MAFVDISEQQKRRDALAASGGIGSALVRGLVGGTEKFFTAKQKAEAQKLKAEQTRKQQNLDLITKHALRS